ncbi:MAG: hypothetical protein R2699_18880 [Acidimicrobiales bacterium]
MGIDIGTTSVGGRRRRRRAGCGALCAVHEVRMPGPGVFEHDPDLAWRAGVLAAFEECARASTSWP